MKTNKRINGDNYGQFEEENPCECKEEDKRVLKATWDSCKMSSNFVYFWGNVGLFLRLRTINVDYPTAKMCSHDFICFEYKCQKCQKLGNFVIEYTDTGPSMRYGKYCKTIQFEKRSKRIRNKQIIQFRRKMEIVRRKGFKPQEYNKYNNNCKHFAQQYYRHI